MPAAVQLDQVFAKEVLTYLDGLYRYAMVLSHNQAEAEDLVQETYLRGVQASGQLVPGSNLKSWLYAILRNAWLNQIRHQHSGPQIVDLDDDENSNDCARVKSQDDPYTNYVSQAQQHAVRAAVNSLPLQFREVIVLREFEGLSYQEIGDILSCPCGTVMSRLGRARDRLRQALSQWDQSKGPVGISGQEGSYNAAL